MEPWSLGDVLALPRDRDAGILTVEPTSAPCARSELDLRARRVAAGLAGAEARGARVLVSLPPGPDFFAAFFGCLYAGLIPVPTASPVGSRRLARLRRIVAACEASRVLCGASVAGSAASLGVAVQAPDAVADADPIEPVRAAPGDIAYLQFTSGSTATPRGVKITHRAALANLEAIRTRFQAGLDGPFVSWLPLHHDMGLVLSLVAIASDVDLVLLSPEAFTRRPWSWLEAISERRASMSGGPNFAYELLCRTAPPEGAPPIDLSGWKVALCGSEPVRLATMARFAQRFSAVGFSPEALTPAYGLAEFTLFATAPAAANPLRACPVPDDEDRMVCDLGGPPPGHRMVIVGRETRQPLAQGQVGELLLSGPSMAGGYWGEADDGTFQATVAGEAGMFLRTGDLGFIADGSLHVVGRAKELLIVRGRNLAPDEVEQTARAAHPSLRGFAAAYALGDDAGFGLLCEVEFGVQRIALELLVEAIQRELARSFGATAEQIGLMRAGTMPRTSSGKALRSQYAQMIEAGDLRPLLLWQAATPQAAPTPRSGPPTAAEVRAWIGDYLALRIGFSPGALRDQDLLQSLGLDSMGAVELTHGLEDWLRRPIEPTVVWNAESLGELCALLAGGDERRAAPNGASQSEPRSANDSEADIEQALRAIDDLAEDEVATLYKARLAGNLG